MDEYKEEIWVFIECFNNGNPKNVGFELLNEANRIAEDKKIKVVAIILGKNIKDKARLAIYSKAKKVILIDNENFKNYNLESYVTNFYNLIMKYNPYIILIGATSFGRDLAPQLSCRLKVGLTADCTKIELDEKSNNILWTRPTFGGNLMAKIICPDSRPQIGTIRPGVFKRSELIYSNKGEIIEEEYIPSMTQIELIEEIFDINNENLNLEEADIIVCAGLGVSNLKGLQLVKKLAIELNASVGATRAVVDSNLLSRMYQIGQTGKSVTPKIYIACGVSGAIQHQVGMKNSDTIIAINKDEEAPIFSIADYKIVGDLFEILPLLLKKIKEKKS